MDNEKLGVAPQMYAGRELNKQSTLLGLMETFPIHVSNILSMNYLSDSGILAGNFDRSGSLSTNVDRRSPATNPGHTLDSYLIHTCFILWN